VVDLGRDDKGRPAEALVLRDHQGHLRAYRNLCRHLPVPLDGGSREFFDGAGWHLRCGTHGALYRLHDGRCVHGPCGGKALEALEVREEAGTVVLDISRVGPASNDR
jgi:nitrite reductase/ring-hydroxylating ferredoxin subunit